jgi:glycosidase
VGEVFDGDPAIPSFFQGGAARNDGIDTGVDSVFDFPIFFNIRDVFAKGADLDTIPKTLAKDRLYAHPERLVTFLGNHDVARYMSEQGATVENLKLAWTFLFTLRGIPSLYYGDELGMTGDADPENRRDFPGGWKDDTRNAFDAGGRTADENAVFNHVQKLLAIRAATEALRRGTMTDLAVTSHAWVYARESGSAAAIIAINNGAEAADLEVPWKKNGTYKAQLGVTPDLIVSAGFGKVHLAGHSAEIYIER